MSATYRFPICVVSIIICVVFVIAARPGRPVRAMVPEATGQGPLLDLAPFALRCCASDTHTSPLTFDYDEAASAGTESERTADGSYVYGLQWSEERDINEVRVGFKAGSAPVRARVEYWFRNWPYVPPKMPSMEDPSDDPWNGKWLSAESNVTCGVEVDVGVGNNPPIYTSVPSNGSPAHSKPRISPGAHSAGTSECVYTFQPLSAAENPNAGNLPGLKYRRTLKLRLVFPSRPELERVQVFSGTRERTISLRVQLGTGAGETEAEHENSATRTGLWAGRVSVFNGRLLGERLWQGSAQDSAGAAGFRLQVADGRPVGLLLDVVAARPALPGSNDITLVTLNAGAHTFTFAVPDVEQAPLFLPDFGAYVTLASDSQTYSPAVVRRGRRIREMIPQLPEQSYERARREIPHLNPVDREGGERLYVPLAADSSWQKFAFQWGGNVFISKTGTKAKGRQLQRLEWPGDRIQWLIGTGHTPEYQRGWHDSTLSESETGVPIAVAGWKDGALQYSEEAYSTILDGPLAPDDPKRSEDTPAVLMLRLQVENTGASAGTSDVWVGVDPAEAVTFEQGELRDGALVRALVRAPARAMITPGPVTYPDRQVNGLHIAVPVAAGEKQTLFLALPFIPRLSAAQDGQLRRLSYDAEHARVLQYWQPIVDSTIRFDVPEPAFMKLARALVAHIRVSATKDAESGLYMDPAASYDYDVFENEGVFQCLTLDALGQHRLAEQYLDAMVRLQGSKPMPGAFSGSQAAVYHGARINADDDHTSSDYNLDHGTVLWGLAEHYLISRDAEWLKRTAPSMMRAADWIIEQRQLTKRSFRGERVPEYGLLPAGHLEDNEDWAHWFAVNAFATAGMVRMAQAFEDAGADVISPDRTRYYAREAQAEELDLRDSALRAARRAPVTRLRDNTAVPWIPSSAGQRLRLFGPIRVAYYRRYPTNIKPLYRLSADRELLYGPMMLLNLDIFHPNEPAARWTLDDWEDNGTISSSFGLNVHGWVDDRDWFSRGGMVFQANLQNPTLVYLRRSEIPAAIRNLYNDFVACYYPEANAFTEEYHQWVRGSGPFFKIPDEARFVERVRQLLVREAGGEEPRAGADVSGYDTLWLAAGVPRRWLAPGEHITVTDSPTYFGRLSYNLQASAGQIDARVTLPAGRRLRTAWLVLRVPDGKPLRDVEIDGSRWQQFDAAGEKIQLPITSRPLAIVVHY